MAAYRRVYDSRHLLADCSGTLRSVIEYGLPFYFFSKLLQYWRRKDASLLPLAEQRWEYRPCSSMDMAKYDPKSVPFRGWSGPHHIHCSVAPRESILQLRHLDRFSRFCGAHNCIQQTDACRHTHTPRYVSNSRPLLCTACVRCGLIIITERAVHTTSDCSSSWCVQNYCRM